MIIDRIGSIFTDSVLIQMDGKLSYYDKVFREPEYIWQAGFCNLDLIETSIETQHLGRLEWLADTGSTRIELSDKPASGGADNNRVGNVVAGSEAGQTASQKSEPIMGSGNPNLESPKEGALRNAVVPLLSLVWNGAEPQNYVSLCILSANTMLNQLASAIPYRHRAEAVLSRSGYRFIFVVGAI